MIASFETCDVNISSMAFKVVYLPNVGASFEAVTITALTYLENLQSKPRIH
jgi:hypothetical protein